MSQALSNALETRSGYEDRALDEEVAVRVMGYRWVEWDHAALRGAPLDQTGSFLASPDDPVRYLHKAASNNAARSDSPFARVPRFTQDLHHALVAANAVRMFEGGGTIVSRDDDGPWTVRVSSLRSSFSGASLPELLCRAALACARTRGR